MKYKNPLIFLFYLSLFTNQLSGGDTSDRKLSDTKHGGTKEDV